MTPETLFLRAQQTWIERAVPRYERFRIPCDRTFLSDQCASGEIVEFTIRMSDGRTFARTVGDAAMAARVVLLGGYITGPDGTPLGFYRVLPTQPGGYVPLRPPNMAPDPLVPTIASASAVAHAYAITLVGQERIDAYLCDHLALRPLLDPNRFALRDLWIDDASGNVVALTYEHDFGNGKYGPVRYRFAPEGAQQVWSIVHIEADAPGGSLFGAHASHVESDLDDIAFPDSVPDADFTPVSNP